MADKGSHHPGTPGPGTGKLRDLDRYDCDYFLLDTFSGNAFGGVGRTFDHSLLRQVRFPRPFFLAGGLDPENVKAAIEQVGLRGGHQQRHRNRWQKRRNQDPRFRKRCKKRGKTMSKGRFGRHGGQYVSETLMNAVLQLEEATTVSRMIRNFSRNSGPCTMTMPTGPACCTMRKK